MKKSYILLVLLSVFGLINLAFGQTVFFEEDFENKGMIPDNWINIYVSSTHNWRYEDGGYTTNPDIPNSRKPVNAYEGEYNALFEKTTLSPTITKLVTPEIDLELAIKPELHFWFANYTRTLLSPANDKIRVYYRSVDEDTYDWVLLHEITEAHEEWTEATILIPDSVRFSNVELAFEGDIGPGWGACIDNIEIIETGIIPKYLESVKAIQASTNIIPTNSINNPIIRIDFTVKGNDGNLFIDTLIVDALLESEGIVPDNGVKLYFTTTSYFTVLNPVSDSLSYIDGKATFTGLNVNLPYGYSYLWITNDIPTDEDHQFNGKKIDAEILQGNIIVNGLSYPFVDLNPPGSRTIAESICFDDFEDTDKWSLEGEFEIDEPLGLGGAFGSPDPDYAQNGSKVMGTDLTGLGISLGDYENNLTDNEYTASSNLFSCKYYKDIKLQYYQWLNIENSDSAKIQIDKTNTNNWQTIWRNTSLVNDSKWTLKQYSIKQYADRQEDLSIRFVIGPTNNTWTFSGWNIDDIAVTGTFIHSDVGITALVSPDAGCGHIAPEELIVTIKNFGFNPTNDTIPLGFSVDEGDTWKVDTLFVSLDKEESVDFTFSDLIDLTTPGDNHVIVKTFLETDQDTRNDQFDTTLFILPTLTIPYDEDFETNNGYWQSGGSGTWEYGIPGGSKLDTAASGLYAWATGLANNYPDEDSSWIESPCFDFTNIEKPVFEVKIASETEIEQDGLSLYYTIDEGNTWSYAPKVDSYDWNWYTNTIEALNVEGWDSVQADFWMARQTLPAELANVNPVKFRLVFASDDENNFEGFVIDDIRIYDAPTDAGVTAVVNPVTSCYLSENETVTVTIKNFGIRDFTPSDNLITTLELNNEHVITDTFNVSANVTPNSTVNFTFSQTLNLRDSGEYTLTAFTHVLGDSNIYSGGISNDSLTQTIEVQGEPDFTLGPDIGTLQPDTVVLDAGVGYTNYEWNDASTNQTLALATEGTYSVTVTNTNSCTAIDTVSVINSVTDLSVTAIAGISTGCEGVVVPALEVTVTNLGDTTYHNGDTIQVGYQINEGEKIVETINITADIINGNSVNYTFSNQPDFSIAEIKNFKCFSVFSPDLNYRNDTSYQTIEIYPQPVVDLGTDTIYSAVSSPIILDAGAGFAIYDWQDNSSLQTFNVVDKTSQKYYVEVTDVHACGSASDTAWVFSNDWVVDTILTPTNACVHSTTEPVQIKIKNNSQNTYSTGFEIPATITLNSVDYNETIVLLSAVAADETFSYTFSQTLDLSEIQEYNISVQINPETDIDSTNNEYSKRFETYGISIVDLGEDSIVTKQADTILLDAGPDFASYSWNKGGSSQNFQITQITSEFYKVTVEDPNGCATSSDSVQILASDVGIDNILSPKSQCELTETEEITFVLHNYGNDIIAGGTNMSVFYQVDNDGWIEKSFSLPYDLAPDKTKTISIEQNLMFLRSQNYTFGLAVSYNMDLFNENDTLYNSIFEFDKPSIDLGEDVYTTIADTVRFEAQPGYANYQWQDFSKQTYFDVEYPASATYHCLVNNAYGCIATDTVMLYTYDISIASIDNLNNCNISANNIVTINIQLNSKDTLQAGDEITAEYTFDGNTITETIVLTDTFTMAATLPYSFTTPFSITESGNFTIICSVEMDNEVVTNNNSLETDFRIGAYSVNLGEDIITYEESVILDAGAGFSTYLWNDESTEQTLEVNTSGKYSVTATDENICQASDSIYVNFVKPGYEIVEIYGLADSCVRQSNESISMLIENTGNDTIFADSVIPISYQVNNSTAINENYTFVQNLNPDSSVVIQFATTANLQTTNTYSVNVTIQYGSTINSADTTVNTFGLPIIDLGEDIFTYESNHTLQAGSGFSAYLWNDDSTDETLTVNTTGNYSVTVTDNNTCENSDDVMVTFLIPKYDVTSINGLNDSCLHATNESITFELQNSGNDTIFADTAISIWYKVNTNDTIWETFTFENKFEPGNTVNIVFDSTANLSNIQSYQITTGAIIDTIFTKIDSTINTWGIPAIDLGNDIESMNETEILNAGEDFSSYLWKTDETTQTITVDESGEYWVIVTDNHGCTNSDTVNVHFLPVDLKVSELVSPLLGCTEITNEEVSIILKNSGSKVITEGTTIIVSYKLEDETRIDENIEFANDMNPEANLTYNFSNLLTIENTGNFNIKFFVRIKNIDTDSAEYIIPVHEKPVFFGGEDTIRVSEYPYELNPQVTAESYLWNTNETTQTITINNDGEYWLKITEDNSCNFTDTVYVKNITGINDIWSDQISVYPNPGEYEIWIDLPENIANVTLQITDINGKLIYTKEDVSDDLSLDISNWKQGIYLLRINNAEHFGIYQIVKQ